MNLIKNTALIILMYFPFSISAQNDSSLVVASIEKYIRSFYESKPEWFISSVHTNLAKRTIADYHGAAEYLKEGSYEEMILLSKIFNQKGKYGKQSKVEINLLDLEYNTASAKVDAEGWYDYVHLAKINGSWKIVNILWGFTDHR